MACTFFTLALDDPETDILAAAKRAFPPKPKKPKTEPIYATQLSRFSATLYNPLLIYLRILSRGRVPLILEVGKEFLRIPCRHPLYFTVFLIYIFAVSESIVS